MTKFAVGYPTLSVAILQQSFEKLTDFDCVLGPSTDGGYYLLGLNKMVKSLFSDVAWSTENVYSETFKILNSLNIEHETTPTLSDIDVFEDLPIKLKLLIS